MQLAECSVVQNTIDIQWTALALDELLAPVSINKADIATEDTSSKMNQSEIEIDPSLRVVEVTLAVTLVSIHAVIVGLSTNLTALIKLFKKPAVPLIVFTGQFVCLPLVTCFVAFNIFTDHLPLATGPILFILRCSPGGFESALCSIICDSKFDSGLNLAFASTLLAMVIVPLWTFLAKSWLFHLNFVAPVSYHLMATLFLSLTLSLAIGVAFRNLYRLSDKTMRNVTSILIATVFILTLAGVSWFTVEIFSLFTSEMFYEKSVTVFLEFTLVALVAFVLRLPLEQMIFLAIETSLQNSLFVFAVIKTAFLGYEMADLMVASLIARFFVTCFTFISASILFRLTLIQFTIFKSRSNSQFRPMCQEDQKVTFNDEAEEIIFDITTNIEHSGDVDGRIDARTVQLGWGETIEDASPMINRLQELMRPHEHCKYKVNR